MRHRNQVFQMNNNIYKVLTSKEWARASKTGFVVTDSDRRDGFVHLSTASQLALTVDLFFTQYNQLVLLQIDGIALNEGLIFEDSLSPDERPGLFPHLYGELPISRVIKRWCIERGAFALPREVLLQSEQ